MNEPFAELAPPRPTQRGPSLELITAAALQEKAFPPIEFAVDQLLPTGLTLFCGRPKIGKSWAALDLALSIAEGGQWMGHAADQGAVLTLALEDNARRLQNRMNKIRPEGRWPEDASFCTSCPRLDQGGIVAIENWINQHPQAKLVVVDTLACVKPVKASGSSDYQADYAALRELHRIAAERSIAIVVIHHVRKAGADSGDLFDTVSGSTGLTGAADTTILITKRSEDGGTVLYGRGRDVAEYEHGLEFDTDRCRWKIIGDPDTCFLTDTRSLIIEAMKAGAQTPANISDRAGLTIDATKGALRRMVKSGLAQKKGHGTYTLPPTLLTL